MIRPGGRGQWFVLAMFQRAKMRQPEQYGPQNNIDEIKKGEYTNRA